MLAFYSGPQNIGFHPDGSYVFHHAFPYIGGYGLVAYRSVLTINYLLKGSPWDVSSSPEFANVGTWSTDTFLPWNYRGTGFDIQRGRGLSNPTETATDTGTEMIVGLVSAAELLDDARAGGVDDTIRSRVKALIQGVGLASLASNGYVSLWDMIAVEKLMNRVGVPVTLGGDSYRQLPASDTAIARRDSSSNAYNWAFALKMMSASRMANYETLQTAKHRSNLAGWNQGSGWTQLLVGTDIAQYDGGYWVTSSPWRVEGTTTIVGSHMNPEHFNGTDFAGGATDGVVGASGFSLAPTNGTIRALKSYFVFDQEIAALGTNISGAPSGVNIETTLLNRKLKAAGNNALTINGYAQATSSPASTATSNVRSLWVEGNKADSSIGVYFPAPTTIQTKRSLLSGCWHDINDEAPACGINPDPNNYQLEIWQDHGIAPNNASYAYVLLPGLSSATTLAYARTPDVAVLKQDQNVHAVKDGPSVTTMANFWTDTPQSFSVGANHPNMFTCDHRASFIEHQTFTATTAYSDVFVSDPTQANAGSINCEIKYVVDTVLISDPKVSVTQRSPTLKFSVDVNGALGKTFHLKTAFHY